MYVGESTSGTTQNNSLLALRVATQVHLRLTNEDKSKNVACDPHTK